MKTKQKTKIIIIRGIKVKVLASDAPKLEQIEREHIRGEWNKNNLID